MSPVQLLSDWLDSRLSDAAKSWLNDQRGKLRDVYSERTFHMTLGLIPRRLGKDDLKPSAEELRQAQSARKGWDPAHWSVSDAARTLVLLEAAELSEQPFAARFGDLCRTADVAELIGLYRGLAIYPQPESLESQAAEGVRTNMRTVFEAVAHHNPYPFEYFSQERWNQMVLKALFVGSLLDPIQGLDQRANEELAQIMCDYAHERWAAGREISPEVWRCVGPFAQDRIYQDLARAAASDNEVEAQAAMLSIVNDDSEPATQIHASRPELFAAAQANQYSWSDIARALAA